MNTTNQKRYEIGLPQVIIEDIDELKGWPTTEQSDKFVLDSMYKLQSEIYKLFSACDIRETQANTISPSTQNIFIPLKAWQINLGGCFAEIKIQQRMFEGCFATIEVY